MPSNTWPEIPYAPWAETCDALHLWSQIVGKYRLAHTPWVNHSWHATLYVTPRGLTTGPVHDSEGCVALSFDFIDHLLTVDRDGGKHAEFALEPMSVADFLDKVHRAIEAVGGTFTIHGRPNELVDAKPFADDTELRPYDRDAVTRFHAALLRIVPVFERFRTSYLGKVSPAHLFWGSFDLAITRFSGRPAPLHPGGFPNLPDAVTREAYSHEVSSAGFWPGQGGADEPMFYAYAYPMPDGYEDCLVQPDAGRWDETLGEFVLPYEAVRNSSDPEAALLAFLQSTYAAAADLAEWDRGTLEVDNQKPRVPRPITG